MCRCKLLSGFCLSVLKQPVLIEQLMWCQSVNMNIFELIFSKFLSTCTAAVLGSIYTFAPKYVHSLGLEQSISKTNMMATWSHSVWSWKHLFGHINVVPSGTWSYPHLWRSRLFIHLFIYLLIYLPMVLLLPSYCPNILQTGLRLALCFKRDPFCTSLTKNSIIIRMCSMC